MPTSTRDPSSASDPEFWASGRCAEQAQHGKGQDNQPPEPGTAVLVGPPGSGKTTFLASFGRAFEWGGCPSWTRFVPGRKLTELMREASSVPEADESPVPLPTTSATTYAFQLGFRPERAASGADRPESEELEVSVLDTPGAFFEALIETGPGHRDQDWVDGLACAARNARCLVLCVDAGPRQIDRKLDLSPLVNRLLAVGPRRLLRVGAKPWPANESPWERAPRLELPFDRVLVLLTGIETLCNEVGRTWARLDSEWLSATPASIRSLAVYPEFEARKAAELLDPWSQVSERVDGLSILLSSLKPNARLAVCGISTGGLDASPLRGRDDSPEGEAQDLPFWLDEREALRDEVPFGIWASILYITTGRTILPVTTVESGATHPASRPWTGLPSTSTDVEHP